MGFNVKYAVYCSNDNEWSKNLIWFEFNQILIEINCISKNF